ncbi:uncharacterized protein LOC129379907 [Poeciliopsis prolifica]|uniref:uncharacterized protein LOC129379907 n=1 Tax=Poeciliopsis prolifica TaxID=188132 RepID=UPI00241407B3|nr:uncharacterized protein LOC129379907 [Poeciliopsis prolifica]
MLLLSVLLLLLLVSGAQSSHYRGTLMTYCPKETKSDGSVSVILRFKFNFDSCQDGIFQCTSGNCGVESTILVNTKIDEASGSWCQSEKITTRLLPNNSPLQLAFTSSAWLSNKNGIGSWKAVTDVELRDRSDTNRPNASPQTTIFPVLRVPSNCQRNISLLAFDPDGDQVKCRYANQFQSECESPCTPPSVLSLSPTCILSFGATSSSNEGNYAVQMVMEDFPQQSITLTHTNGAKEAQAANERISMIPVQFALQVDSAAPSCTDGVYLPRFVSPTPEHGARFYSPVSQTLEIKVRAEADQSTINEILFSGPNNVNKSSSGSGSFTLKWTPSASEAGQSLPICFIVQASASSFVYQSELRCVIVTVGDATPPKTSHVKVVKLKIKTSMSLKDKQDEMEKAIQDQLITGGLPADIKVHLLSFGIANKTAAP